MLVATSVRQSAGIKVDQDYVTLQCNFNTCIEMFNIFYDADDIVEEIIKQLSSSCKQNKTLFRTYYV
jgi:hypothetical protein